MSIEAIAGDVVALVEQLGLARVVLNGWSSGRGRSGCRRGRARRALHGRRADLRRHTLLFAETRLCLWWVPKRPWPRPRLLWLQTELIFSPRYQVGSAPLKSAHRLSIG